MSGHTSRNDEILTDDYVAGLMAHEAKDCSLKYSALGMEAFRDNNKKPTNMPKPNTRFLRHIIKDTDTHNKNLLAKEAAESKARLENLEHAEEAKRLKTNPNTRDIRKRQLGDITAILEGKRRRREDAPGRSARHKDDKHDRKSRLGDRVRSERRPGRSQDLIQDVQNDRRHHGRLRNDGEADSSSDNERPRHKSRRRRRSMRDGGGSPENEASSHRGSRRRARSRSRDRRQRSRSPRERSERHVRRRSRSPRRGHSKRQQTRSRSNSPAKPQGSTPAEDSDPLEDLVGPAPAPKHRGRGRLAGSAGIDRRFSESYDPSTDVLMDDMEEETGGIAATSGTMDDAVEMFRDRQKLKLARLNGLAAGGRFEEQARKPKAGESSGQTPETEVRWSKKGNEREWDRGKVTDEMI